MQKKVKLQQWRKGRARRRAYERRRNINSQNTAREQSPLNIPTLPPAWLDVWAHLVVRRARQAEKE